MTWRFGSVMAVKGGSVQCITIINRAESVIDSVEMAKGYEDVQLAVHQGYKIESVSMSKISDDVIRMIANDYLKG